MATVAKPRLTLNGKEISDAEATKLLVAIYGDKRAPEIIEGVCSGKYGGASVASGYIEKIKPAPTPDPKP